ncbi:MAG: N-acetyltransferase [Candidatus Zixiibacteriota bacterium]
MTYEEVEIIEVEKPSQLAGFIKVPWKIYAKDPNWVPPLISAQRDMLNPKKNPFFRYASVKTYIARHGGENVGRIAAIVNRNHNEFHEEKVGFFGFFESINDYAVARKLLKTAMIYLKSEGMEKMRGPVNLSTNYEVGALIDAFDLPPVVNMTYNPSYYVDFYDKFGFAKIKDLLAYHMTHEDAPPERLVRIAEKIKEKENVTIRSVDMKKFDQELKIINQIYNSAWSKNWGFIPVPDDEFVHIAKDMKQIIDPDLVLIAEVDGNPIGFSLTLPNVYQVLPYANGRLFPLGMFKLLWHTKVKNKIDSVRIITLGVEHAYQKRGIDAVFYVETYKRGVGKGYRWGEMSWILEDNVLMNRAAKMLGGKVYKTYRVYEQSLNSK